MVHQRNEGETTVAAAIAPVQLLSSVPAPTDLLASSFCCSCCGFYYSYNITSQDPAATAAAAAAAAVAAAEAAAVEATAAEARATAVVHVQVLVVGA